MNHTKQQLKKAGTTLKNQRPELSKLINSVLNELQEPEQLNEVLNHGCISGTIPGLIYYHDTCKFYRQNKAGIIQLIKDYSDSTGENITDLINNNNHLSYIISTGDLISSLTKYSDDYIQLYNWLTWFGFEQICYMLSDILEQ